MFFPQMAKLACNRSFRDCNRSFFLKIDLSGAVILFFCLQRIPPVLKSIILFLQSIYTAYNRYTRCCKAYFFICKACLSRTIDLAEAAICLFSVKLLFPGLQFLFILLQRITSVQHSICLNLQSFTWPFNFINLRCHRCSGADEHRNDWNNLVEMC